MDGYAAQCPPTSPSTSLQIRGVLHSDADNRAAGHGGHRGTWHRGERNPAGQTALSVVVTDLIIADCRPIYNAQKEALFSGPLAQLC